MNFDPHVDIVSAVVFLGASAALVLLAILVAQRLERRTGAAFVSAADERLAGPEEREDACGVAVAARGFVAVAGYRHPVAHVWSEAETDRLVELFRVGFRLDELAAELDIEAGAVAEELARRAFGAVDPVADPSARRFGQPWTATELRTLDSATRAGLAVSDIARQLGRDQLSTVFRMLEAAETTRTLQSIAAGAGDVSTLDRPVRTPGRRSGARPVALHG